MGTQIETKNKVEKGKRAEKTKQAQKNVRKALRRRGGEKPPVREKAKPAARPKAAEVSGGAGASMVSREASERAFRRAKRAIGAVSLVGRPRITAFVPAAVEIGLGALPYIEAKKGEIKKAWPDYDLERAGRLRDYAYAALYAHLQVVRGHEGATRLRALLEEGVPLREWMLRVAEVHAYRGDFDAGRVADIRRGTGHRDTALDLIQLATLFREAREALAGRTQVTEAEIARAAEIGSQIIDAIGQRRLGSDGASTPAQAEEDRAKAFWLYFDTYEASRRGMAHLRWAEGDADRLVPSLFSQIGGRRRGPASEGEAGEGDGEAPAEPADPSESD